MCCDFIFIRCLSVEKFSLESRLQKCESDYEQHLCIANDQVESLQKELQRYELNINSYFIIFKFY